MADPSRPARVLVVGGNTSQVRDSVERVSAAGLTARGIDLVALAVPWLRGGGRWLQADRVRRRVADRVLRSPGRAAAASRAVTTTLAEFQPDVVAMLDYSGGGVLWQLARLHPDLPMLDDLEAALRVARGEATVRPSTAGHALDAAFERTTKARVLIGPRNKDGLATTLALAMSTLPGVQALSVAPTDQTEPTRGPCDVEWDGAQDPRTWLGRVEGGATHCLVDDIEAWPWAVDAPQDCLGALLLNADDLVDPLDHAHKHPWSVFREMPPDALAQRSQVTVHRRDRIGSLTASGCVVLVTGPGPEHGLDRLPWPVFGLQHTPLRPRSGPITVATWATAEDETRTRLDSLALSGEIRHVRVEAVPVSMRRLLIARADVVVDRIGWGGLGWAGLEGLGQGALVLRPPLGDRSALEAEPAIADACLDLMADIDWPDVLARAKQRRTQAPGSTEAMRGAVVRHHGERAVLESLRGFLASP